MLICYHIYCFRKSLNAYLNIGASIIMGIYIVYVRISNPPLCMLWFISLFFMYWSGMATAQMPANSTLVFLKAFYSLDEPRFHCVDIPGHKKRVDVSRALSVHTCKEGIWHKDELFDLNSSQNGMLRMPAYDLCIQASNALNGAKLILKPCAKSELQSWDYSDYRLTLKAHPDKCLTIGSESSKLTPGGKRLPSRNMARSLELLTCSETAFQRQLWRFELPQKRTSPVLPFAQ